MSRAMLNITRALTPLRREIGRLAKDQRGVSAVEFALLAPLMITVYLGGVEVSQAVSIDRKVSLSARAVADLVSQGTTITNAEMDNIKTAAKTVVSPFPTGQLKVTVSSVKIDADKKAKVEWSDALNTSARPKDQDVTLPAGLTVANTWIIWAEVEYAYTPAVGYVLTGTMKLSDQIYMRPRLQDSVGRTAS
jgi:Flp pilus assembly protein TadG